MVSHVLREDFERGDGVRLARLGIMSDGDRCCACEKADDRH
jgi:hypothetical protein